MSKRVLLVGSAMGALAFAGAAFAQPTQSGAGASTQAQQSGAVEMGGVVITAERRDENLQDVPVAVTAFTSETRDVVGINTLQDFTNFTPGLVYSTGTDRVSVRGIGRLTNVQAADPGVANYSDGIYTSSLLEASKSPLFVQRVEVLRGPQGTLYGRNSIGGAINVISVRPTRDWYAEVRGTAANYSRFVGEAAISGPIVDGLQFRLVGAMEHQEEPWFDNGFANGPEIGNIIDTWIIEGQLQFQVGNFDGWIRVATAGWDNNGGGPGSLRTYTPFPYATNVFNGPAALTVNPTYALSGLPHVIDVVNNGVTVNPSIANRRSFAMDTPEHIVLDNTFIAAAEFIYHFDNFDLKWVTGGTSYHYRLDQDLDETAASAFTVVAANGNPNLRIFPQYSWTYQEEKSWYSNEFTLSTTHDGAFQFIIGAYQYHEEYDQPVFTTFENQPQVASPVVPFGLPGAPTLCAAPGFAFTPTFGGVVPDALCTNTSQVIRTTAAPPNPLRRVFDNRPHLEDDSWAVFGQADWSVTDQWTVTLGLRYSEDHKFGEESVRLLCVFTSTCVGPLAGLVNPLASGATLPVFDITQFVIATTVPVGVTGAPTCDPATGFCRREYDYTWDAVTGTFGIQFEPNDETLAYFRYARGYKAGGFNVGIATALGPFPWTDAEESDAFEIGLKRNWGRTFQLNAAIYYYNYQNAQVPVTIANNTGGVGVSTAVFFNIPEAVSMGFELETIWSPIPDLQILFNYALNDAHITRACCIVDPADPTARDPLASPSGPAGSIDTSTGLPTQAQDLRGNRLPNAPLNKISLNVNYTWHFDMGDLTASANYIWRDVQYGDIFTRSYTRSPSWDQFDARLVFRGRDNRYTVIVYGRNLTNEINYNGGAGGGRRGNGSTITGGVLAPTSVVSAYPLSVPRTFGLEVQYRFF